MNKEEFIKTLTQAQRDEFEQDIRGIVEHVRKSVPDFKGKYAKTNINLQLQGELFLNVSLDFTIYDETEVVGLVTDITKYGSKAEYDKAVALAKNNS